MTNWRRMGMAACIGAVVIGAGATAGELQTSMLGQPMNNSGQAPYTVKKHDSLIKIAKAQLGSAARWREIAKLNGIKKPYTLEVGAELKLSANAITMSATPNPYNPQATGDAAPRPSLSPVTYQPPPPPMKEVNQAEPAAEGPTTYQPVPAPMTAKSYPDSNGASRLTMEIKPRVPRQQRVVGSGYFRTTAKSQAAFFEK